MIVIGIIVLRITQILDRSILSKIMSTKAGCSVSLISQFISNGRDLITLSTESIQSNQYLFLIFNEPSYIK